MCRAIWVVVVGASDEACKRLRRAAGPDAQVVAMSTSLDEALSASSTDALDVIIIDGSATDATATAVAARERAPGAALVWVGEDAPEGIDRSLRWEDASVDTLPGAITAALIARRRERAG